jgi:SAM-dependent methyltransferase
MRLNLGAGATHLDGFTSVDLSDADICHDLSVFPWPFADNSADAILASHVLEHFSLSDACHFLAECARILKPGARLSLAVPDLDKFVEAWRTGDFRPLGGYAWVNLNTFMGGGFDEPREAWRHKSMWNWSALAWECRQVGLVPHRREFYAPHTEVYRAISLYVDAHKPYGHELEEGAATQ